MKKVILPSLIALSWIFFRSNQYFEDRMYLKPEVKGEESKQNFFLPFPKDFKLISESEEENYLILVGESNQNYKEIVTFYQEILRSKNYLKEYEFEDINSMEIKYSKNNKEIIITSNKIDNISNLIFKYNP